ncbi:MAG: IS21 family transposase [Planctomycetes bacterium]|nr:IS21 family transposase [Planctomycetota bacterium]
MTAQRIDMHRLQDLIRLHRQGTAARAIARALGMGRDTVRMYLGALQGTGLLDGPVDALPELEVLRQALVESIPARVAPQQASSVDAWLPRIAELRRRHAGPTAIFDRLRLENAEFPGSLSAVKRACLRLRKEEGPRATDVALRVETRPGEVAQVDFGYAGQLFDPARGLLRRAWVFLMVLGHSRHQFAEIVFDQRAETWIDLHIQAFEFFGGVPEVIVPDNLKAAVIRAAFSVDQGAELNRSYRELARYYGFRVDPAPPREPKKKGKVESGVKYCRQNFLAACDATDVVVVRRELVRWIMEVAGRRIHGTTGRRPLEVFESEERLALRPLPTRPYERVLWKRAKVHTDAHVQIDGAFYSAPWRLLHEYIWGRCTATSVALYHHDILLYRHRRLGRGRRNTVAAHVPTERAALCQRSRSFWEERAAAIGVETHALVCEIFDSDDVLSKLRVVQAVVTHLLTFPRTRAEAASRRARHFGSYTYGAVKAILRQGLDLLPLPGTPTHAWLTEGRYARSAQEIARPHQGGLA